MGFLSPKLPRCFDVQLWHLKPRPERIQPLAKHWAESGFGTPWAVYVLYLAKIAGYLFVLPDALGLMKVLLDWR